jgi:hypothetical protein
VQPSHGGGRSRPRHRWSSPDAPRTRRRAKYRAPRPVIVHAAAPAARTPFDVVHCGPSVNGSVIEDLSPRCSGCSPGRDLRQVGRGYTRWLAPSSDHLIRWLWVRVPRGPPSDAVLAMRRIAESVMCSMGVQAFRRQPAGRPQPHARQPQRLPPGKTLVQVSQASSTTSIYRQLAPAARTPPPSARPIADRHCDGLPVDERSRTSAMSGSSGRRGRPVPSAANRHQLSALANSLGRLQNRSTGRQSRVP